MLGKEIIKIYRFSVADGRLTEMALKSQIDGPDLGKAQPLTVDSNKAYKAYFRAFCDDNDDSLQHTEKI